MKALVSKRQYSWTTVRHKMFVKGAKLRRNESPGFDSDEHQNVFITSLAKILTSNVLVIIA